MIAVDFALQGEAIVVNGTGLSQGFVATITLNPDGECKLKVAGVELDRSQVLRMALEELSFDA